MTTELQDPEQQGDTGAQEPGGEWPGVARRLLVAFLIAVALAGVCWKVLPTWGVYIPPAIPLIVFGLILVPYILSAIQDARERRGEGHECCSDHECSGEDHEDGARPIGCCGPRPVGETLRRGGGCGGGGGCCRK